MDAHNNIIKRSLCHEHSYIIIIIIYLQVQK